MSNWSDSILYMKGKFTTTNVTLNYAHILHQKSSVHDTQRVNLVPIMWQYIMHEIKIIDCT